MTNESLDKTKKHLEDIKNKSLEAKKTNLREKIDAFRKNQYAVLLCDTSGSMDSYVGEGIEAARAIDVVNNVLESFQGAKIYEFNSWVKLVPEGKLNRPSGGTDMARAFAYMKTMCHKEIILLTDGIPDSHVGALQNAKGLKLNIIYIGPQPTPQFLKDLAKATNGNFVDVELIKLGAKGGKEIESKIRGFLNA